ncbi:MAG: transglycosylase domain-containing protein [Parcubacteria group bacterium]
MKERRKRNKKRNVAMMAAATALLLSGMFLLWIASLRIPALEDLSERRTSQSTRIYDRTGEILLYDLSQDVRRSLVAFEDISPYAKQATIAIEDQGFYSHSGFKLSSFIRAMLTNATTLSFSQGGSTITQQVVKNSILTKDKTPTRKLKELILALKLDGVLTKDEILNFYLNEIPYGGNLYGIEEASTNFFGKSASDLTLPEAAYLAAIPKAPTYYSPYGRNTDDLEYRKNLVLKEMFDLEFITEEEYNKALVEEVEFKPRENTGSIKAPHFVFFVIDYLAERYGEDALQNGGFKVITTLDYDMQVKAQQVAKKYGEINDKQFNGENDAFVAIDPKTGEILVMVGSRDYFDDKIDGNFNVAIAHRQPGSAFKPLVYAELFNKGYTPNTVIFDVPTQFGSSCNPASRVSNDSCYAPNNYTNSFQGPVTVRNALAQSMNVPAVKVLYLAGINDSIDLAKSMGIGSLTNRSRYGLALVLGGGEVSPLDMAAAYSVFANDGIRNPYTPILRVESADGGLIEQHIPSPTRVLPAETARNISDILSDNVARTPLYGANSPLYFQSRDVAVKTGTTNDYRDAWIVGYTPSIALATWAGNNDNSVMERKVSGLIVAPMWRELMDAILPTLPQETFPEPEPVDSDIKPILRGDWSSAGVHTILHWVYKDNPRGPVPANPSADSQFSNWEYAVRNWVINSGYGQPPPVDPTLVPNPANPYYPYQGIVVPPIVPIVPVQ